MAKTKAKEIGITPKALLVKVWWVALLFFALLGFSMTLQTFGHALIYWQELINTGNYWAQFGPTAQLIWGIFSFAFISFYSLRKFIGRRAK